MNDVIELIKTNGAAVFQAPFAFAVCVAVAGLLIYLIMKSAKAQEISDLNSRLSLKNDEVADYQRKLQGKTPDEAKAAIDDLTQRLAKLEPVTLSDQQLAALAAAARTSPGSIMVMHSLAAGRLGDLQAALLNSFAAAGWRTSQATGMGMSRAPSPIVVRVDDPQNMNPAQRAACEGLTAAGLAFHLVAQPPRTDPDGFKPDLEIILGVS